MPSLKLRRQLALLTWLLTSTSYALANEPTGSTASYHGLDGMAPAGHWAARLTVLRNDYTHRYDASGRRVDLDAGYDGLNLATYGLAGRLNLDSHVTTEFTELMFGYGISEDLTLGAIIPYARTQNHVNFSVSGGIGTAGMQSVLTGALGYKPLRSATVSGWGDPTVGALWRFHKTERESAVVALAVRFGIAREDDPDDLMDVPPGDGSTDIRARLEYFRDLGSGFDLRLMGEYQMQTPDEVTLRPGNPLTSARKEKLRRDLGDYQEYDVELGKTIGNWRLSATWHRYQEEIDRYYSRIGSDTSFLMANTDVHVDQYRLGLTWSGIRAWQAGQIPLPLIIKLEMQDVLRARNFVDVRDIYLRVISFF